MSCEIKSFGGCGGVFLVDKLACLKRGVITEITTVAS